MVGMAVIPVGLALSMYGLMPHGADAQQRAGRMDTGWRISSESCPNNR
jgi:hypothetical protein